MVITYVNVIEHKGADGKVQLAEDGNPVLKTVFGLKQFHTKSGKSTMTRAQRRARGLADFGSNRTALFTVFNSELSLEGDALDNALVIGAELGSVYNAEEDLTISQTEITESEFLALDEQGKFGFSIYWNPATEANVTSNGENIYKRGDVDFVSDAEDCLLAHDKVEVAELKAEAVKVAKA